LNLTTKTQRHQGNQSEVSNRYRRDDAVVRLAVAWEGQVVGYMVNPRPDMFFLYGAWVPVDGLATDRFLRTLQACVADGEDLLVDLIQPDGNAPAMSVLLTHMPDEQIEVRLIP
jgi:hypothetical protein